jgi:hypothetical protein
MRPNPASINELTTLDITDAGLFRFSLVPLFGLAERLYQRFYIVTPLRSFKIRMLLKAYLSFAILPKRAAPDNRFTYVVDY